jgi:hypothetical protein
MVYFLFYSSSNIKSIHVLKILFTEIWKEKATDGKVREATREERVLVMDFILKRPDESRTLEEDIMVLPPIHITLRYYGCI